MAWRPHGHVKVSPRAPVAAAVCDRCGMWYNITDLSWQFQWAGPQLQNLRLLVCRRCLDVPQPQLKPRIIPPDPMPVLNARPENFLIDDIDGLYTDDSELIVTQDDEGLIVENEANYRGFAPAPTPNPPIISASYLVTGLDGALILTDDGEYIVVGGT